MYRHKFQQRSSFVVGPTGFGSLGHRVQGFRVLVLFLEFTVFFGTYLFKPKLAIPFCRLAKARAFQQLKNCRAKRSLGL